MSKSFKIFIKVLLAIFGVIIVLLGAYTLWAYISWSSETEFNVEGRLGNIDVPAGTLHVMCSKGELDIKKPADIDDLGRLLPQITETCGINANAILLYGGKNEAYDILMRKNSKFAPEHLIVLKQNAVSAWQSAPMSLLVFNASTFEKEYEASLGTVPSFMQDAQNAIEFKDHDQDGKMEAWTSTEFPAAVGHFTLHRINGNWSGWRDPAPNFHYGFMLRDGAVYCGDTPRPDLDPSTFIIFNSEWQKDPEHIYHSSCDPEPESPYDVATFVAVDPDGNFVKDKNGVWWEGYSSWAGLVERTQVEGADPETFTYIGNGISKDRNRVYDLVYPAEGFEGVDAATLEPVHDTEGKYYVWMRDKSHLYHDGDLVADANPDTFYPLTSVWGADEGKLFFNHHLVPGGDPVTLRLIDEDIGTYLKDKSHVYYSESGFDSPIIANADYATFRPLDVIYAKDSNHVFYYGHNIIEGADPATFEVLKDGYSRDKNHVYISGNIVEGADPATYVIP